MCKSPSIYCIAIRILTKRTKIKKHHTWKLTHTRTHTRAYIYIYIYIYTYNIVTWNPIKFLQRSLIFFTAVTLQLHYPVLRAKYFWSFNNKRYRKILSSIIFNRVAVCEKTAKVIKNVFWYDQQYFHEKHENHFPR